MHMCSVHDKAHECERFIGYNKRSLKTGIVFNINKNVSIPLVLLPVEYKIADYLWIGNCENAKSLRNI